MAPPPFSSSPWLQLNRPIQCADNETLVAYFLSKRKELVDADKISDNLEATLSVAHRNITTCKTPIQTIQDLSKIKGVGLWILKRMEEFFSNTTTEKLPQKGKRAKGSKPYLPKKKSVAYALLITLYRELMNGRDYMKKQELIDAAGGSGLCEASIVRDKGLGKPGQPSSKDWYTGWNAMTTLINKGLVVRKSNPAKYMLTDEGKKVALDCIKRSGLTDFIEGDDTNNRSTGVGCAQTASVSDLNHTTISQNKKTYDIVNLSDSEMNIPDVSSDSVELLEDGSAYLSEGNFATLRKDKKVLKYSSGKDTAISGNFVSMNSLLQTHTSLSDRLVGLSSPNDDDLVTASKTLSMPAHLNEQVFNIGSAYSFEGKDKNILKCSGGLSGRDSAIPGNSMARNCLIQPCTSLSDRLVSASSPNVDDLQSVSKTLPMPPRLNGDRFNDVYDVILLLDNRENFCAGAGRGNVAEMLRSRFKILVEIRRLPVGDGTWIVRHRHHKKEYILDFIVERKRVDDLKGSLIDNRYKDQKLRLLRCGLQKLIYLVEGDPNQCEGTEAIKTACFTTEIVDGFDVIRTAGLTETIGKYGHLTRAITQFYSAQFHSNSNKNPKICPTYVEFIKRCHDLNKMTISKLFSVQLMQVPRVVEDIALAVVDLYPTLISLYNAYKVLEGDVCAQEQMLMKQSNLISKSASKNIYNFVWISD
ncbi:hypothetical protein ZOSMA_75G00760 [Zostera marina]|uniref:Crossover junction endonuclease MUS81 n=1 Tax=Zostera marina TaxID=29655 RepID=A0A0K9NPF5_ZOSMR|nr:hypothetical protein ZOSMA_75G00760 [Zostera marina]